MLLLLLVLKLPATVLSITLARPVGNGVVQGRIGSSLKDIAATLAMARVFNVTFVPPPAPKHRSDASAFCQRGTCVSDLLDLSHLWKAVDRLGADENGTLLSDTLRQQVCPSGWSLATLHSPSHTGFTSSASAIGHVSKALAFARAREGGSLCAVTTKSFRFVHPPQLLSWERQGEVPAGTYGQTIRDLRQALHVPFPGASSYAAVGSLNGAVRDRHASLAVHVRRGDIADHMRAANPATLVAHVVRHASLALLQTGLFDTVSAVVVTEPNGSRDVFADGCPRSASPSLAEPVENASCSVNSSSVVDDFQLLARSTLLVVSSSSFSTMAHFFRPANEPTMVVGNAKAFFGSDPVEWPPNLISVNGSTGSKFHTTNASHAWSRNDVPGLQRLLSDDESVRRTSDALRRILRNSHLWQF